MDWFLEGIHMAVTMVSGDEDGSRLTGDDVELGDDGVAGCLAC